MEARRLRAEPRARGADRRNLAVGLTAALGALLAGCHGQQSALDPRGPQAARLFELTNVMFIGSAVIFALVMVFLAIAIYKRDTDHPLRDRRIRRGVAIATTATVATLIALFVYNERVDAKLDAKSDGALELEVVGHQWWWEVTYGDKANPSRRARTANEIHLPAGRPVLLKLESRDVIHSFWAPNLHGKIDLIPGRKNQLLLQADQPGVYRGQCAEFCGLQHAHMAFVVVVEPAEEFARWLDGQIASAVEPGDPLVARGRDVFLGAPCVMCHAIRGTAAMATAGPDLTHLASRRTIASGTLPNTRGQLAGWILDPQHIKPGVLMPGNHLDSESLDALLAYLESLR